MQEISVQELKQWIDDQKDFQLIDVREVAEYQVCNLGGELIPMGSVQDQLDKIEKNKPVVMHCRSGKRSGDVIKLLSSQHGFTNLINLAGGILAWSDEIDPSIPKY